MSSAQLLVIENLVSNRYNHRYMKNRCIITLLDFSVSGEKTFNEVIELKIAIKAEYLLMRVYGWDL